MRDENNLYLDVDDSAALALPREGRVGPVQAHDAAVGDYQSLRGGRQTLIVDASVKDADILCRSLPDCVDVHVVAPNGLDALICELEANQHVGDLHILTHGEPGAIILGGERLGMSALKPSHAFAAMVMRLTNTGSKIALWACSVAGGAIGQRFVKALEALTGASVFAADQLVGAATSGGTWDIGITPPFGRDSLASYPHTLPTFDMTGGTLGTASGADSIANNQYQETDGGVTMTVSFDLGNADGADDVELTNVTAQDLVGDYLGTSGNQVTVVTISFDTAVTVDSFVFGVETGLVPGTYTATPNSGSTITMTAPGDFTNSATNKESPSDWTNVTSFTITSSNGNWDAIVDNILVSAAVPANSAPALGGTPADDTAVEDVATAIDLSAYNVSDGDGDTITLTLAVDRGTIASVDGNGTTDGVTIATSGTTSMTLQGSAGNLNTYLNDTSHITYTTDNSDTTSATLTVTPNDGTEDGTADTVTINITPANDAPVLDNSGAPTLTAINEDAGDDDSSGADGDDDATNNANNTGTSIADLVTDGSITDVDGSAVEAIAVTNVDNTNGVWQYSTDNGSNWTSFSGTTGSSVDISSAARLLDGTLSGSSTQLIRFVPDADYNGTATITYRAWDKSTGTAGNTADTSTNGGTTAFSSATEQATVTINAVNDEPEFTGLDGTPSFTEDSTAVTLDSNVTLADVELDALNGGNGYYSGATLTIARNGGANANDSFSFDTSGNTFVTSGTASAGALNTFADDDTFATYTVSGGTLTITFTSAATAATTSLVNDVLQHIQYENTSDDPSASVQLDWSFSDGTDTDTGSTTVSVTGVNDEPTLTATGSNPTFTEGGAASDVFNTVAASTVEAGQTITGLTLTVTNVSDTENEILNIDGTAVTLDDSEAGTTATNSLTYSVSVSSGTATITLSGGTMSTAATQTLVDGISYENTSDNPTTGANRVVTVTSMTDSGGTDNGGDDSASLSVASTVSLTAVNDAPVVGNVFGDSASEVISGAGATAVSDLSDATVTNADSADFNGGFLTIAQNTGTINGSWAVDGTTITSGGDGTVTAGETIQVSGVSIGVVDATDDGQGGNDFSINFNANATPERVETLLQNLAYSAPSGIGDRGFTLTLNDGDGTANGGDEDTAGSFTIAVTPNPPIVSNLDGDSFTFTEGDSATAIDVGSNVTVTDADSSNFNGGNITVSYQSGQQAEDRLVIDTSGTVSLSTGQAAGSSVSVSGSIIGTIESGSTGATGEGLIITFSANATTAAVQTLLQAIQYDNAAGDDPTDGDRVIRVTVTDADSGSNPATSTAADVTVNVNPVNDAASFGGDLTGSLNEDTDSVGGSATATDVDGANSFTVETLNGTYGDLAIAANGDWVYDLDETLAGVQALGAGDTLGDTLTVESADGTEQEIMITVSGVNDAASFGGDLTGSLNEDTDSVGGSATATDVDGANSFTAETLNGTYGDLTIAANGDWVYDLDETLAGVQALGAGDTLGDTLTVEAADGTEQSIVITVSGVNDAASFGGNLTGSLNEDTDSVGGSATVTDPESANQFTAETVSGTYGDLTIAANGDWVYDLDETLAGVQALGAGDTLGDTLTVEAADGTEQSIVITVSGVNDAATFGGALSVSVGEDATYSIGDTATVSDVDGADTFTAETVSGTYGNLTIAANGDWSYDLDETLAGVQALGAGDTLGDTLTVEAADGTEQEITITINGANDAASFGGDLTGSLNEDTDSVGGSATATDVDGANSFTAETLNGTYGDLTIAANGDWVYDLDETLAGVQALDAGDTLGDTLTVESADGTEQSITITISGVNDAASFGGDLTGSLNEDTDSVGGSATATDIDGANSFTAETVGGTYGDLTIAANGDWVYDLDETLAGVQALGAGDTLGDTLTVEAADGTEQSIVITINGANDAATFGGDLTGSLNEDTDSVGGSATATDIDGANSFTAETVGGTYGDLTIAANGDWVYDLDEANTDVQALDAGDTLGDTLTVEAADGTEQSITITISGVNDAASFGGNLTGSLNEDTDSVSGSATVTDPESANQFTAETVSGTYGDLTIAANGDWVYDLDEANTDVQALGDGDTLGDTLTVESADGTEQSIVITVSGVNDAANFGGTLTGSLNEDTDSISGSATVTDPESANQFTAETVGGTFGDLTIAANGDWVYDLDEANTDVQALDAGDTVDDTLTVEAADGTEQSIVITVSGVNDAPQSSAGSVTAVEDVGVTFSAANFAFSDVDTGDALVSVRIDTLPDQGALRYNGGAVTVNQVIAVADLGNLTYMPPEDVDGVTSFTFSVSDGTDWSSAPTVMSITLEGANDPPGMPRLTTSGVSENQIGAFVGTLRAVDPEGDAVTYSTSDSRFRVIGDKLYLAQGVSLDYETTSSITIRVSASDEEGFRSSAFVDIPVIDVVQEGGSNTQTGGTAPDTLRGSGDNDTLSGGGGNDLLDGGNGDDLIQQNEDDDGQDIIVGGAGNDKINAGGGNDFVIGGGANDGNNRQSLDENSDPNAPGADTIRGGSGDDTILGGGWNDDLTDDNGRYDDGEEVESSNEDNVIWAGSGNDVAAGSSGNDILGGSDGGDVIKGLSGDDVIFGNDDDDTVLGGDGDDTLFGGSGNDIIGGGDGDDIIWAGAGDDQLSGGDGADGFIFGAASGNDVISDFDVSADSLDFLGRFSSVEDVLSASADSTQEGTAGVLVNLGDGESVFLSGVTVEQLADANLVL